MYAAKLPGEGAKMYDACRALKDSFLALGCGIDGGKDSLSMAAKCGDEIVKAPGELVITAYVTCPDVRKTITPDLKCNDSSQLLFVDLNPGKSRLGGSSLAQVYNQIGNESPDIEDFSVFKSAFNVTQQLIDDGKILSGHDRSDGGLIVTLLEMAFAGNCGIKVDLPDSDTICALFNEEAGLVLEVDAAGVASIIQSYKDVGVSISHIGSVISNDSIEVKIGETVVIKGKMTEYRDIWEATSFQLERLQRNPECVAQEEVGLKHRKTPAWTLTYEPTYTSEEVMTKENKPKVAILRQEGSNGDREMLAAFFAAGFETWDVTVSDLVGENVTLDQFRGLVFVGGFSYADVLDSGKGWAGVIKFNEQVYQQFQSFKARKDTFSLGVCNGCQLMALLGWIPNGETGLSEDKQPRLLENDSGRFESRFSSVQIQNSPAIMFKGMEGSSLGIWVAHGEGRFHFPDSSVYEQTKKDQLISVCYVNDDNEVTQAYPFNPNGSPDGIAGLCSKDGRHLAMMPHPERCFTTWQWPWMPSEWSDKYEVGPWLKMFQNAREFCEKTTN